MDIIRLAQILGREANRHARPAMPAADNACMYLIQDQDDDGVAKVFQAWQQGWDEAAYAAYHAKPREGVKSPI